MHYNSLEKSLGAELGTVDMLEIDEIRNFPIFGGVFRMERTDFRFFNFLMKFLREHKLF